jgi:serine/threonine-protein kinase RsbW
MSSTVTLTFPADTRNVALARSLAAAMCARADLPLDRLEDVRLAVDEAAAQLIADASEGSQVRCDFTLGSASLDIVVSVPSRSGAVPATTTFSWTVLSALVDSVSASVSDGRVELSLQVSRPVAVDA